MHSPGFSKPAHGYGQPFGFEVEVSDPVDMGLLDEADLDENWAGEGFETPYEEA